jgi:RHS repeat-associated protein
MLLLEEYEVTPTTASLRARYYYAEGTDVPISADLYDGANPTTLKRVYYVTDRMGSVIGLLDESGGWIERVHYGIYGVPSYGTPVRTPPQLVAVNEQPSGDIIIAFNEPVLPALNTTTTATTIATSNQPISHSVSIKDHASGTAIAGTWVLDNNNPNYVHGAAYRFTPAAQIASGATIDFAVLSGGFFDRWHLPATPISLTLTAAPGVLYFAMVSSSPQTFSRSSIGNGLAFQSHLYDPDAGLILARARALNPVTGHFLQRDPSGYRDSVNLYAGFKNDPVNNRDVTGMQVPPAEAEAEPDVEAEAPPEPIETIPRPGQPARRGPAIRITMSGSRADLYGRLWRALEDVPPEIRGQLNPPTLRPAGQRESIESLTRRVFDAEFEAALEARPDPSHALGTVEKRLDRLESAIVGLESRASDHGAQSCTPLTISRAYWFESEARPSSIPASSVQEDGSGHVLMHIDELKAGEGVGQYRDFYAHADKSFVLRAPGEKDIPIKAERGMWMQEFYLRIAANDVQEMKSGVAYDLVPLNRNTNCKWQMRGSVQLSRS